MKLQTTLAFLLMLSAQACGHNGIPTSTVTLTEADASLNSQGQLLLHTRVEYATDSPTPLNLTQLCVMAAFSKDSNAPTLSLDAGTPLLPLGKACSTRTLRATAGTPDHADLSWTVAPGDVPAGAHGFVAFFPQPNAPDVLFQPKTVPLS